MQIDPLVLRTSDLPWIGGVPPLALLYPPPKLYASCCDGTTMLAQRTQPRICRCPLSRGVRYLVRLYGKGPTCRCKVPEGRRLHIQQTCCTAHFGLLWISLPFPNQTCGWTAHRAWSYHVMQPPPGPYWEKECRSQYSPSFSISSAAISL